MRSPVFRRPGCRRHAGTTKRRPKYATPEVVAGCHCTTRLCGTQDDTHRTTAEAQPRTTSGVRLRSSDLARPASRHDPAWRNTGLRTAATTSGVAEMLASGHRLRQRRRAGAAPDGKPRGGVPDHNPALTQLCRDKEVPSHDCVPKVRPSLHHTLRNRGVPLAHIPYISCKPGTTA